MFNMVSSIALDNMLRTIQYPAARLIIQYTTSLIPFLRIAQKPC